MRVWCSVHFVITLSGWNRQLCVKVDRQPFCFVRLQIVGAAGVGKHQIGRAILSEEAPFNCHMFVDVFFFLHSFSIVT